MPVIARFYGIINKMYFLDHGTPHFHAVYGEYNAVYEIDSLTMIEGDLPRRAQRLITEWGRLHRSDLRQIWDTQEFKTIPPLDR